MTTATVLGYSGGSPVQGDIALALEDEYADLRERCIARYGPGLCNAVLPNNLVYAMTRQDERPTIPWWGWVLMGVFVGKVIL